MKRFALIVCAILLTAQGFAQTPAERKVNKIKWLLGWWSGSTKQPGEYCTEKWLGTSLKDIAGKRELKKGHELLYSEKLSIQIKGDDVYYVVEFPGKPKPVAFKITRVDERSFICENRDNDFPKQINYIAISPARMKVTNTGFNRSEEYSFNRIK